MAKGGCRSLVFATHDAEESVSHAPGMLKDGASVARRSTEEHSDLASDGRGKFSGRETFC